MSRQIGAMVFGVIAISCFGMWVAVLFGWKPDAEIVASWAFLGAAQAYALAMARELEK